VFPHVGDKLVTHKGSVLSREDGTVGT
jgi:hypothetical protein